MDISETITHIWESAAAIMDEIATLRAALGVDA